MSRIIFNSCNIQQGQGVSKIVISPVRSSTNQSINLETWQTVEKWVSKFLDFTAHGSNSLLLQPHVNFQFIVTQACTSNNLKQIEAVQHSTSKEWWLPKHLFQHVSRWSFYVINELNPSSINGTKYTCHGNNSIIFKEIMQILMCNVLTGQQDVRYQMLQQRNAN